MATTPPLSFASMAKKEQKKSPIRTVQLEGQVVLKIAKHCKEQASGSVVTGQLLGLDVGQTLEVTDCFPFPGQTEEGADNEGEDYQLEMMRCLREINVDNNMVGWYLSTISGSYQVVDIIEIFVTYMENLERCICIVYDTAAASTGSFGFKAIRLTDTFVEAYKSGGLTIEKVATRKLSWRDVFVEIPITLHNSPMAAALAAEISSYSAVNANDLDRLTLTAGPVLEKNLEFLNDCLDDLVGEQTKLNNHHHAVKRQMQAVAQWKVQRRQENQARRAAGEEPLLEDPPEGQFKAIQEPSQLDNMLLANQMSTYCDHIGVVASEAINKLLLVEKLQKTLSL